MERKGEGWEGPLVSPDHPGDPKEIRLRSHDFPGWMVIVRFGSMGEVLGVTVEAYDWKANRRRPLTVGLIHSMGLGAAIARARIIASTHGRARSRNEDPEAWVHWSELVSERTGTRGKDDLVYARAASEYVRLIAAGETAPLRAMANELNRSESRVRNIIHEARKRKLLTSTKQGKRGGQLTAKARRLLEGEEQ